MSVEILSSAAQLYAKIALKQVAQLFAERPRDARVTSIRKIAKWNF